MCSTLSARPSCPQEKSPELLCRKHTLYIHPQHYVQEAGLFKLKINKRTTSGCSTSMVSQCKKDRGKSQLKPVYCFDAGQDGVSLPQGLSH